MLFRSNAEPGEEGSNVSFGAIVGSGLNSNLVDCGAHATINLTDKCYFAGIIAGSVQDDSSIINCIGGGIINAAAYCMEMGGICGAGWDIKEISDCTVDDIVFNLGYDSNVVGSIAGLIGISVVEDGGVDPAEISNCSVNNLKINTAGESYDSADMVGYSYLTEEVMEQYNGSAYTTYERS